MIETFYSLVNVDQRFDRLVLDSFYVHHLDLTFPLSLYHNSPVNHEIFDRIRTKILPQIHHKVTKLTIAPSSVKYILKTIDYPVLTSLSLVNFQSETLFQHLTGDNILPRLVTNQVTHLEVSIGGKKRGVPDGRNQLDIFSFILSIGKCLTNLTFRLRWIDESIEFSFFDLPSTTCVCSSLTKLVITVYTFDDCLYLLDGRLKHLSILIVNIMKISMSLSNIDNTVTIKKSMDDVRPFENELFKIISQDFPFLESLSVVNGVSKKNKEDSSTFITFPHLLRLDLALAHTDYALQFLFDKNTILPRLMQLDIGYGTLATVTEGFTNDGARCTCAPIESLVIQEPFVRLENFFSYFPSL